MRLSSRVAIAATATLVAAVPSAHADIFAVTDGAAPGGRGDSDVLLVNATTGARQTLPAAVNSTANESHPSITTDGNRLAFERKDPAGGTARIILVDLPSAQAVDLFNGFEAASNPPDSPFLTHDGKEVLTGGPFQEDSGKFFAVVTRTDVTGFPAGPFNRNFFKTQYGFTQTGRVTDPVDLDSGDGSFLVFRETRSLGELIAGAIGGNAGSPVADPALDLAHPTFGSPGGPRIVAFDQRRQLKGGTTGTGDIAFRGFTSFDLDPPTTLLPAIVNSPRDESRPAFTSDSRYLGFVRHDADGHDRLFLWDSQTQLLVDPTGVDLGAINARENGNLSLYTRPVINTSLVTQSGVVRFSVVQATGIGILVQRVTGHHRLFGRSVPKLRLVGRVPLGNFKKGHGRANWNLRVGGKRLRPGKYQVTPRAVTAKGRVRELGKSRVLRIR